MSAILGMMIGSQGSPGVVTLSGATGIDNIQCVNSSAASALLIIRTDGTTDKEECGGNVSQINSATDWIRPTGSASSDFEVRFGLVSGDTPNAGNGTLATWQSLGSDLSIGYGRTLAEDGVGFTDGTIRVQIRYLGGAVIASAEYDIEARIQ